MSTLIQTPVNVYFTMLFTEQQPVRRQNRPLSRSWLSRLADYFIGGG